MIKWVSQTLSRWMEPLHERTILVLSLLLGICLILMMLHITHLKSQLLKVAALTRADVYTRTLTEMQRLYASEVVERARSQGIIVTHNYAQQDGAIPPPDILSQKIGSRMGTHRTGEVTHVYPAYPFPRQNTQGNPQDRFGHEAWNYLKDHPEKTFFKFVEVNGRPSLRYATARSKQKDCLSCHGTRPMRPDSYQQTDQAHEILEVRFPMGGLETLAGASLNNSYGLMSLLAMLWLGGLGLVITKLRRTSDELEKRVKRRTADLKNANQMLQSEIHARVMTEKALREARDDLEKRVQERTAKLAETNVELTGEIVERKQAEEGIRKLNTNLLQRTTQLEVSNKELEAFSYSVSHDLRAPLRGIDGFSQAVLEDYGEKLDKTGKGHLQRVRAASQRMSQLIDAMLNLARLTRRELHIETVDLSSLAHQVLADLEKIHPDREVKCHITDKLVATADPQLVRVILENLLGNAWKFTSEQPQACLEFGIEPYNGQLAYFVRDNGAGFDMTYAHKLFGPFQRLHAFSEYPGVGIGLATVQRIIQRHGGEIWAEGAVEGGATFHFTLQHKEERSHEEH